MSAAQQGILFVVSAPSATGKSTLAQRLVAAVGDLAFSVSYTTRERRSGEADGRDYHFIPEEEFRRMIDAGAFLEWAEVFGHSYGTGAEETRAALRDGRDLLLDIDVQGAAQVRRHHPEAVSIFIMPPDFATLSGRLHQRGRDDEGEMQRRLRVSAREVGEYESYRYVVVNDRLERAVEELHAIVVAERARTQRRRAHAESIAATLPVPEKGPA